MAAEVEAYLPIGQGRPDYFTLNRDARRVDGARGGAGRLWGGEVLWPSCDDVLAAGWRFTRAIAGVESGEADETGKLPRPTSSPPAIACAKANEPTLGPVWVERRLLLFCQNQHFGEAAPAGPKSDFPKTRRGRSSPVWRPLLWPEDAPEMRSGEGAELDGDGSGGDDGGQWMQLAAVEPLHWGRRRRAMGGTV